MHSRQEKRRQSYKRRIWLCKKLVFTFLKSLCKKCLPLKFPIYDLKRFETVGMK